MKTSPNESDLAAEVLKYLRSLPATFAKKNHQTGYSYAGYPDIDGITHGEPFYIELKRPGKYDTPDQGLSEAQRKCISKLCSAGARVLVTDNLEDVKLLMESING